MLSTAIHANSDCLKLIALYRGTAVEFCLFHALSGVFYFPRIILYWQHNASSGLPERFDPVASHRAFFRVTQIFRQGNHY